MKEDSTMTRIDQIILLENIKNALKGININNCYSEELTLIEFIRQDIEDGKYIV